MKIAALAALTAIMPAVRRFLLVLSLLAVSRCAAPPPPVTAPETPPPPPLQEAVTGKVTVTASALNVRREPLTTAEVITQVKKGTELSVLTADESWTKVRLEGGETGWVASRFVSDGAATSGRRSSKSGTRKSAPRRGNCPADSDFAFTEAPMLTFSDSGAHGLVVVDATVNSSGVVTATKVVSNSTGDETLAFLTEREIRKARFSPPIRDCAPRSFIFTYRRTF